MARVPRMAAPLLGGRVVVVPRVGVRPSVFQVLGEVAASTPVDAPHRRRTDRPPVDRPRCQDGVPVGAKAEPQVQEPVAHSVVKDRVEPLDSEQGVSEFQPKDLRLLRRLLHQHELPERP